MKKGLPKVIHFEIPADNPERAVAFYEKAFGWKAQKYGTINYYLVTAGEEEEVGINGAISERSQTNPATTNTISVEIYEESVERIKQAGGEILMPKTVVQGVGYMTYCKDSEGNIFGIMQTDPNAK